MQTGRPTWPYEPLYKFLTAALPDWRTPTGILDVVGLADEIGLSKEAIYKWFRTGNLPAKRCRELHEISQRESNLNILAAENTEPPELSAFYDFSE